MISKASLRLIKDELGEAKRRYRRFLKLMHTSEAEDGLIAILRNEAMPASVREAAALVIWSK